MTATNNNKNKIVSVVKYFINNSVYAFVGKDFYDAIQTARKYDKFDERKYLACASQIDYKSDIYNNFIKNVDVIIE